MTETSIASRRSSLPQRLFPSGIPRLWCPSLTHYDLEVALLHSRIGAHLRSLSRHVKGFLIPGSTGDGWELSDVETRQLLEIALDQAQKLGLHVLLGMLKPTLPETLQAIADTIDWLKSRTGER